jgi:ATP-dependent RNA helicase RhlE
MSFDQLGLPPQILSALKAMGLSQPTPIQEKAIPVALSGRDVLGIAQTGTGKTVAFGAPLIAALMANPAKPAPYRARGLILAPTRELATQIVATLTALTRALRVTLVTGGKSISPQIAQMARGTDILVATPGRLIDLIDRRAVNLAAATFLVLDEADQMLDIGFVHALRRIAPLLSRPRQTMMFSATMPKTMEDLAQTFLEEPVRVEVTPPGRVADKVAQSVHYVDKAAKPGLLINLIDAHRDDRALVFVRTKHGADRLMTSLERAGFAAAAIHGNKSQGQRDRALDGFRKGEIRVLVATDVAARGIDIPGIGFVYNYDLPDVPETYVHRIGRTARAGADGRAVAFCTDEESGEMRGIERLVGFAVPVASGTPWPGTGAQPQRRGRPQGQGQGKGHGHGNRQGQPHWQGQARPGGGGAGKPGQSGNRRPAKPAARRAPASQ